MAPEARYGTILAVMLALHAGLLFGLRLRPPAAPPLLPGVLQAQIATRTPVPAEVWVPAPLPPLAPKSLPEPLFDPAPAPNPPLPPVAEAPPVEPPRSLLPQIEAPLVEDPTFYPAAQVDITPRALHPVKPAYPERARKEDIGGYITLLLLIDERGAVREISVAEAVPEGVFEESAVEAFRHARFAPAERKGRPVKSRALIRVTYEVDDPDKPAIGGPPQPKK